MNTDDLREKFEEHVRANGLRHSSQREAILTIFLESSRHFTAEELHTEVIAAGCDAGVATIYRALKLFCEAGVCSELRLNDGVVRYEPALSDGQHEHLVCEKCGECVEVFDDRLRQIFEQIARESHFNLHWHRLNLFGLCSRCAAQLNPA